MSALSVLVVVKTRDKLKAAVCNGKRPDLSVICGPDELLTLVLDCISLLLPTEGWLG